MKKQIPFILFVLTLFACSIPSTPTPLVATQPPVETDTLEATLTNPPEVPDTPIVTVSPPLVTNVTCNELSLYLDPALASGYDCQTIPESSDELEMYPAHTELTLQGYLLADKFFAPHISIYPVQRYSELLPDFIPERVSNLQTLIGGGAAGDSLPFLPVFNAAQTFHAQYHVIPFVSGSGIRYLTLYAQYTAPVNNHDLFYTYQGLTSDGRYWVSAILPINNPILPADAVNPPGGVSWEQFSNNYGPYITDMINQLNSQASESYTPTLAALDALVTSITIQP